MRASKLEPSRHFSIFACIGIAIFCATGCNRTNLDNDAKITSAISALPGNPALPNTIIEALNNPISCNKLIGKSRSGSQQGSLFEAQMSNGTHRVYLLSVVASRVEMVFFKDDESYLLYNYGPHESAVIVDWLEN